MKPSIQRLTNEQRDTVAQHMPLCHFLAHKAYRPGFSQECNEALTDAAIYGLIKAVHKFDPERKVPFPAYATMIIRRELSSAFREQTIRSKRRQSLKETYRPPVVADPRKEAEQAELVDYLLHKLTPTQREVIRHYIMDNRTRSETAQRMKCSPNQITHYLSITIPRLRSLAHQWDK